MAKIKVLKNFQRGNRLFKSGEVIDNVDDPGVIALAEQGKVMELIESADDAETFEEVEIGNLEEVDLDEIGDDEE